MTHSLVAVGALTENPQMSDELMTTVRIQRPSRIQCDGDGKSVWAESVGTAEFELLSTVELKKILKDEDVVEPVVEDCDGAGFNPYDKS